MSIECAPKKGSQKRIWKAVSNHQDRRVLVSFPLAKAYLKKTRQSQTDSTAERRMGVTNRCPFQTARASFHYHTKGIFSPKMLLGWFILLSGAFSSPVHQQSRHHLSAGDENLPNKQTRKNSPTQMHCMTNIANVIYCLTSSGWIPIATRVPSPWCQKITFETGFSFSF